MQINPDFLLFLKIFTTFFEKVWKFKIYSYLCNPKQQDAGFV